MQIKTSRAVVCAALFAVACASAAARPKPQTPDPTSQATSSQGAPVQSAPVAPVPAAPASQSAPEKQATPPPQQNSEAKPPQQQGGGQAKPDQQPPPTQKPTFTVKIELVTQDVIVRDSKGVFLPDLKKDEFQVYEDGVLQDIASMDLVHGGRHTNVIAPPPTEAPSGILLPTSRPQADTAGRILIFFIDDLHVEFSNTSRLRNLLKQMEKTLIHDGDMFAVQTSGPSSVAIDLTYDRKRFSNMIEKIQGSELKPSEIINGPEGAEGPSEVRYRAHVAFSTVNDMLQTLDQVHNRRKALIYVSDGYDFNPFENARTGQGDPNNIYESRQGLTDPGTTDPFSQSGREFADADLVRDIAELTRTANRANVTMYTVDPRGLVGMGDLDEQVDPTEWLDYLHKAQDSLRVLAEQTGGFAVINQNDFTKALQKIDAETSDYYILGYYSKNPDPTKRWRTIEVKITRPDVTVIARKGYQLKRPPKGTTTNK